MSLLFFPFCFLIFIYLSIWFQDWGIQQKKANRSSEKNRKKLSAVSESRLTNDISPESTPGAGRRRARTPHSFPHVKYATQMSVPDQAELDRLRQRINFTDLDEVKHTHLTCVMKSGVFYTSKCYDVQKSCFSFTNQGNKPGFMKIADDACR